MNYLLDTLTLIWFLNGNANLSSEARKVIEEPNNSKYVSVATIWEIAIKMSLERIKYKKGLLKFLDFIEDNGFEMLPINFEHALIVSKLKFIHQDPFDRLIVAQAKSNHLTVITKDEQIGKYGVKILW